MSPGSTLSPCFRELCCCSCIKWVLLSCRTREGETALQLAISNQLPLVVDAICTRGADMSVVNDSGDPPLWLALDSNLEDIASTLVSTAFAAAGPAPAHPSRRGCSPQVRHGCDVTCWSTGPSGCQQTLLHRAIDENNEVSACFLIRRSAAAS